MMRDSERKIFRIVFKDIHRLRLVARDLYSRSVTKDNFNNWATKSAHIRSRSSKSISKMKLTTQNEKYI